MSRVVIGGAGSFRFLEEMQVSSGIQRGSSGVS